MVVKIDQLTGIRCREQFYLDFEELEKSGTTGNEEGGMASLALCDLDFFSKYNKEHGDRVGDEIIKHFANYLKEGLGESGEVYRYGGEEFVLLLPGTEKEQAFLIMEQLRKGFEEVHKYRDNNEAVEIPTRFSSGVSTFGEDGQKLDEVLRKADGALYRAKVKGRNKVCIAREEKMVPKTVHYTQGQLKRLGKLKDSTGCAESSLLREALDDLLRKYKA